VDGLQQLEPQEAGVLERGPVLIHAGEIPDACGEVHSDMYDHSSGGLQARYPRVGRFIEALKSTDSYA
jgi:hypothetical protein